MSDNDKIKLNVTSARLENYVTVDEVINAQDGDLKAIRDMLARFVVDENDEYIPFEDAVKLVGELTIAKLKDAGNSLITAMEVVEVPKGK